MTLDEMYDQMDLYGFEDFEDSQKLLLLNESYLDIATREPWPFLEKAVEFIIPSSVSQITSGGSFKVQTSNNTLDNSLTNPVLYPYTEYYLNSVLSFTDLSNDIVLTPERNDVIEKNYRVSDWFGTPCNYYFLGDDLFVYPTSSGGTYRLYFLQSPVATTETDDTAGFLIPTRHHSIIVYGALVKAFLVNDDPQAAVFQNAFESRYQQMRNDIWMNQYDRTDRVHVLSDSSDWFY